MNNWYQMNASDLIGSFWRSKSTGDVVMLCYISHSVPLLKMINISTGQSYGYPASSSSINPSSPVPLNVYDPVCQEALLTLTDK